MNGKRRVVVTNPGVRFLTRAAPGGSTQFRCPDRVTFGTLLPHKGGFHSDRPYYC